MSHRNNNDIQRQIDKIADALGRGEDFKKQIDKNFTKHGLPLETWVGFDEWQILHVKNDVEGFREELKNTDDEKEIKEIGELVDVYNKYYNLLNSSVASLKTKIKQRDRLRKAAVVEREEPDEKISFNTPEDEAKHNRLYGNATTLFTDEENGLVYMVDSKNGDFIIRSILSKKHPVKMSDDELEVWGDQVFERGGWIWLVVKFLQSLQDKKGSK